MRRVKFKATIQADGTVVLPLTGGWKPGEAEITVVQYDERSERPWMQFVGTISENDGALAAIEECCETIEPEDGDYCLYGLHPPPVGLRHHGLHGIAYLMTRIVIGLHYT